MGRQTLDFDDLESAEVSARIWRPGTRVEAHATQR